MAKADTKEKKDLGENMIIVGLFVQIVFFGLFIVVSIVFHRRMLATPMHQMVSTQVPWTKYMKVLYFVSVLIMVRSVYRVAEYVQGSDGALQGTEAYLYVFDAALMFLCCVTFNIFHPSKIVSGRQQKQWESTEDMEMLNNNTAYRAVP